MISAERLKTLRSYFANKGIVQNTPRPTIAELEKLLSQDDSTLKVEILPSGEVRATSGAEWTDAVSVIDECLAARQQLAEMRGERDAFRDTGTELQGAVCNLTRQLAEANRCIVENQQWAQTAEDDHVAMLACVVVADELLRDAPLHGYGKSYEEWKSRREYYFKSRRKPLLEAPTSQPSRGKCDHQGATCYTSTGSNIAKCSRCGAEFDMRQLPYGWPDVKPAPDCAQPEQSEGHPPGVVMDSNGAVTEWFNSLGKGQPELITNPTVAAGGVVVVAQPERQGADTIRVLCDNGIALAKRRDEMTGGREGAEHHGDYEKLFREIKRALRPSPPQDDIVAGLREMHEFLRGAGTLNGCAFGERPIGATGNYWWRKPLGIVIDRAIAALGEKGWQPIDTAPKNGTPVLLFKKAQQWVCSWDSYSTEWWVADGVTLRNATHWKPLDAPPVAGGKQWT